MVNDLGLNLRTSSFQSGKTNVGLLLKNKYFS